MDAIASLIRIGTAVLLADLCLSAQFAQAATIAVDYGRPLARGRVALSGEADVGLRRCSGAG